MTIHAATWMFAVMFCGTIYLFFRIAKLSIPALMPVGRLLFSFAYAAHGGAHTARGIKRERNYSRAEIDDLRQSNFSVPENWLEEADLPKWEDPSERTWSEITAGYQREDMAVYERTDSGRLRELPFDTSELPAITDDVYSYPRSNVRVYWEPPVRELAPYPTRTSDPEDEYAYDASRWSPTQVLEPVG